MTTIYQIGGNFYALIRKLMKSSVLCFTWKADEKFSLNKSYLVVSGKFPPGQSPPGEFPSGSGLGFGLGLG